MADSTSISLGRVVAASLRFHWRSHLGVVLGAAVGSAALIGALVVGDSVRESLRERALERLGRVAYALSAGDRLLGEEIGQRIRAGLQASRVSGAGDGARREMVADGMHLDLAAVLQVPATAARQDGAARANRVQLLGVSPAFASLGGVRLPDDFGANEIAINEPMARQLGAGVGDSLILRLRKPSLLGADAPISPRDGSTVAWRVRVRAIVPADELGLLSLASTPGAPLNAFVPLDELQRRAETGERVNLLLTSGLARPVPSGSGRDPAFREVPAPEALALLSRGLAGAAELSDLQLEARTLADQGWIELRSARVFLDPPITGALIAGSGNRPAGGAVGLPPSMREPLGVLTYLANLIRSGTNATPYSMVAAVDPARMPGLPDDLGDDEICVNAWLAADLRLEPGSTVELVYFLPESGASLQEATNTFRVRAILPMEGPTFDRTLMPEFPGVAEAESTSDWEPGFPLVHRIRDKDEDYWRNYKGTPKAFVTLAAGQRMWANRFGSLTAIRYRHEPAARPGSGDALEDVQATLLRLIRDRVTGQPGSDATPGGAAVVPLASLGLAFEPVRERALTAAASGQDFGGLFIGFSLFLVVAALLLMALLFHFGLEQRLGEIGTLLALGFRVRTVRRLWVAEGLALAALGGVLGVAGGILYARAMIGGLTTVWSAAVAGTPLAFHATAPSIVIGLVASVLVAGITLWLALRREFQRPARDLLAGDIAPARARSRSRGAWIGAVAVAAAIALVGWALASGDTANAGIFFGAGSLLLVGGLAFLAAWLARLQGGRRAMESGGTATFGRPELAIRGTARRRSRSLATAGLLASGTFIIAAIGAFRMDAERTPWERSSGTGGFAFIGESSLPVTRDLNTAAGLESFGLDPGDLEGVSFVPFRVRDGDEASCLNLDRAQRPRILGVRPDLLSGRGAFTFARVEESDGLTNGWQVLQADLPGDEIPAIGDAASIQWALGRKIGDVLELTDDRGRPFRLRLVGGVANSILQGNLIISDEAFRRLFPDEDGWRYFLIDAPQARMEDVAATLSRAFEDIGMELTPAVRRLAQFNAVQNTYLTTFQVLGGLGLLLGSAGLGIVVLRNVLERRGELALMSAVGFTRRMLARMVLAEHAALLLAGLLIGIVSAAVAILPSLLARPGDFPVVSLGLTLAGVVALGLLTTWAATRASVRGPLLHALRGE